MKSNLFIVWIISLSLFLFPSCLMQYGNTIETASTSLRDTSCKSETKPILIFFDKEPIDFPYSKIAYLEIKGNDGVTNEAMINRLKFTANNACANAVLFIDKQFADRESGYIGNEESKNIYTAPILSGIAVNIPDTVYLKKLDNKADTMYHSYILQSMKKEAQERDDSTAFSIVTVFLGVIIAILANAL